MSKFKLSEADNDKVKEAISRAESKTSGEIVTAIIKESSDYAIYELQASLVGGFLYYLVCLIAQLAITLFQRLGRLLITQFLLSFPFREKAGKTTDHIVQDDFQVLFESDTRMMLPMEKDMRHIKQGGKDRSHNPSTQSKPDPPKDNRHVVQAPIDVMGINQLCCCQVMHGSHR